MRRQKGSARFWGRTKPLNLQELVAVEGLPPSPAAGFAVVGCFPVGLCLLAAHPNKDLVGES